MRQSVVDDFHDTLREVFDDDGFHLIKTEQKREWDRER